MSSLNGMSHQDLPTRRRLPDCSSRREGSTLKRVEKEAPGKRYQKKLYIF